MMPISVGIGFQNRKSLLSTGSVGLHAFSEDKADLGRYLSAMRTRNGVSSFKFATAGTVVAYVRGSTDEQDASGAGLEAQRAAIEAEAGRRGWTIVGWHADEGVSSSKSVEQRPGLAAAIEGGDGAGARLGGQRCGVYVATGAVGELGMMPPRSASFVAVNWTTRAGCYWHAPS